MKLIDPKSLKGGCIIRPHTSEEIELTQRFSERLNHFEIPTVDAEPVRHGKWHVRPYDIICSACGKSFDFDYPANVCVQDYHYCPNCGAKMDGGEQDVS